VCVGGGLCVVEERERETSVFSAKKRCVSKFQELLLLYQFAQL
jgi:hypothetical protein